MVSHGPLECCRLWEVLERSDHRRLRSQDLEGKVVPSRVVKQVDDEPPAPAAADLPGCCRFAQRITEGLTACAAERRKTRRVAERRSARWPARIEGCSTRKTRRAARAMASTGDASKTIAARCVTPPPSGPVRGGFQHRG